MMWFKCCHSVAIGRMQASAISTTTLRYTFDFRGGHAREPPPERRCCVTNSLFVDGYRVVVVGKTLGAAWPVGHREPPPIVVDLAKRVAGFLVEQDSLDESMLGEVEDAILAQARRSRTKARPLTAGDVSKLVGEDLGAEYLEERLSETRLRLGVSGDAVFTRPTDTALETATRFEARDSDLSLGDAELLMTEIGRLAGPIPPKWHGPKDLERDAKAAISSLEVVLRQVQGEEERVFDAQAGEYRELSQKEILRARKRVKADLESVWFEAFVASNEYFTSLFPFNGPLPEDPEARLTEQDRRAAERARIKARGMSAISELVDPIVRGAQAIELARSRRSGDFQAPPAPQPYGVSSRGAELWVADALRWLGATNVQVTRQSGDGGVDVVTSEYAVSVKNYVGLIPVEEVREILGVSAVMQLKPLLWTSGSLTRAGAAFAEVGPVPVFHYLVETAKISALNRHAQVLLDRGL